MESIPRPPEPIKVKQATLGDEVRGDVITVADAATLMAVSRYTIENWMKDHKVEVWKGRTIKPYVSLRSLWALVPEHLREGHA